MTDPSKTVPATIPPYVLFGGSPKLQRIRQILDRLAGTDVPVLIEGEGGTGKETLARWIHSQSKWRGTPLLQIRCSAIPGALFESELASLNTRGSAGPSGELDGPGGVRGSVLFLDETDALDPANQARLLHFLQERKFGQPAPQSSRFGELQLICSSNRPLGLEVEQGNFRRDLYHLISVVTLRLPALRERRMDVETLAVYFINEFSTRYQRPKLELTPAAREALMARSWDGNIRELRNLIRNCIILGDLSAVWENPGKSSRKPVSQPAPPEHKPLRELTRKMVRDFEAKVITDTLRACNWNRKLAARSLEISYRALFYKMRAAGISNGPMEAGVVEMFGEEE